MTQSVRRNDPPYPPPQADKAERAGHTGKKAISQKSTTP
jgi:hypothetical protein